MSLPKRPEFYLYEEEETSELEKRKVEQKKTKKM